MAELDEIAPGSEGYATLAPDIQRLRVIYTNGPDALDEADRQALVRRHGWFGQLAVSFGKPDTDPARHAALAPAERAALTSIALVLIVIVAFVAGLVLAIVATVKLVQGASGRHTPRELSRCRRRSRPSMFRFPGTPARCLPRAAH